MCFVVLAVGSLIRDINTFLDHFVRNNQQWVIGHPAEDPSSNVQTSPHPTRIYCAFGVFTHYCPFIHQARARCQKEGFCRDPCLYIPPRWVCSQNTSLELFRTSQANCGGSFNALRALCLFSTVTCKTGGRKRTNSPPQMETQRETTKAGSLLPFQCLNLSGRSPPLAHCLSPIVFPVGVRCRLFLQWVSDVQSTRASNGSQLSPPVLS